jgi:aspartyl-tRNA(Asn)/glutamyl-tRNA(Gln) amidotransferase subunit C
MPLSTDEVAWVAHLARLHLNPDDQKTFSQQLSAILDFVDQLAAVNTDGVEPLAHPLEVQNIFRTDEPAASLPVKGALSNAPDSRGDFFVVPAVFDANQL